MTGTFHGVLSLIFTAALEAFPLSVRIVMAEALYIHGTIVSPGVQGPSAREKQQDTTAFEAARSEWGRAAVSIRGSAVGGEGDHHTEVWLG